MKLYYSPGSCSLASHITLKEIGKPHEIEKVDIKAKKTEKGADFWAINPKGYVPAIEVAPSQVLTEGAAILQHLADSNPEAKLAPAAGTFERARLNEWLTFISSEFHKAFVPLFNPASSDDAKVGARANVEKRLAFLDKTISDGRTYLTGKDFTIADAYAFVVTNWTNFVGIPLDPYPNLKAYQGRVAGRAAVQAAMKAEGLLAA
ncbi:MAG: glutathione transferase GstA [Proteobacteria bacterium]|nr:glutathione transferase GstA [Pseudomonadota bacterium]